MPDYWCAKCGQRSGMLGHSTTICRHKKGATVAERQTARHFCCPGSCELELVREHCGTEGGESSP